MNRMRPCRFLRSCVRTAFACFTTVVTYGEVITDRVRSQNLLTFNDQLREEEHGPCWASDKPEYNGLITSVELFVFIITVSTATSLAPYIVNGKETGSGTPTQLVLVVLMFIGLVVVVCFFRFQNRIILEKRRRKSLRGLLTLIGVVIFYTFGCFLDLFHMLAIINCLGTYRVCGGHLLHSNIISITFHLTRIVYLASETMLCIAFRSVTFLDKCAVRYGLMILQASNLALWFDILLRESVGRIDLNSLAHCTFRNECYELVYNLSQGPQCLYLNTTLHQMLRAPVGPNLYPFLYEFTLLVGESLIVWFVRCRWATKEDTICHQMATVDTFGRQSGIDETIGRQVDFYEPIEPQVEMGGTIRRHRNIDGTNIHQRDVGGTNDRQMDISESSFDDLLTSALTEDYLAPPTETRDEGRGDVTTSSFATESVEQSVNERTRLMNRRVDHQMSYTSVLFKLVFLAGVIMNILFTLFNFLPLVTGEDGRTGDQYFNRVFFQYCIFYWLLMLAMTLVGYYCSTTFQACSPKKKFKSLDYLLVISSIGCYIYIVTSIVCIGKLMNEPDTKAFDVLRPPAYIIMELSFFTSIFFQIPFCFIAGRVVVPARNSARGWNMKVEVFKMIVLFLAVSNGVLWVVDTFTTSFNVKHVYIQVNYFDHHNWVFVNNFILPLVLFFRFNSCLLFTRAYLRFVRLCKVNRPQPMNRTIQ